MAVVIVRALKVTCDKFSGSHDPKHQYPDFRFWWDKFELHCKGVLEEQRLALFKLHLCEQAEWVVTSFPDSVKDDYQKVTAELCKQFPPHYTQTQAMDKFLNRTQQQGESVDKFAADLRHLLAVAKNALSGNNDSILAYRFKCGLVPHIFQTLRSRHGELDNTKAQEIIQLAREIEHEGGNDAQLQERTDRRQVVNEQPPTYGGRAPVDSDDAHGVQSATRANVNSCSQMEKLMTTTSVFLASTSGVKKVRPPPQVQDASICPRINMERKLGY
jgi:hypothetical protein